MSLGTLNIEQEKVAILNEGRSPPSVDANADCQPLRGLRISLLRGSRREFGPTHGGAAQAGSLRPHSSDSEQSFEASAANAARIPANTTLARFSQRPVLVAGLFGQFWVDQKGF